MEAVFVPKWKKLIKVSLKNDWKEDLFEWKKQKQKKQQLTRLALTIFLTGVHMDGEGREKPMQHKSRMAAICSTVLALSEGKTHDFLKPARPRS